MIVSSEVVVICAILLAPSGIVFVARLICWAGNAVGRLVGWTDNV